MADKNTSAVDKEKLKAAWREFVPEIELNESVLNKTFLEVSPIFELISRNKKRRIKKGMTDEDEEGKVDLVMKNKMAIVQDHVIAFCQKYLVELMDIDSITQGQTEPSKKINLGDKWDEKLNSLMAFYIIIGKDKLDEDTLKKGMTEGEIKDHSTQILQELNSIRANPQEHLSQVYEVEAGVEGAKFIQFKE